jgi:hypothetical protein
MARPSLSQSPDKRDGHMMFTGFCNQYNPRTHLPTFSNPSYSTIIIRVTPCDVWAVFGQRQLIKDDEGRAYAAQEML